MTENEMEQLVEKFLAAWNSQDVERVAGCYTDDVVFIDPNTRGELRGGDAMRRYLKKLFSAWTMTWESKEGFPLKDREGAAFKWHATFRKIDGKKIVEADGMDLVLVRNGLIARNEVYFDRTVLAPLMGD